ncbi:3'(2'),5'-bisphosphate nucleotidase CysQ [Psychromarinibacter sp. C21-152]|uniref:3'(2'),5'-bisphosphate nucleotidase CysQ n=1 Tax=Psychromarinibacter sediminicola TaxID=3033385 RepID=A0AAE3NXJ1_9RHOB|nr:3'(2'),5'-bisphosphate nucleotidase CysQ [Psychromarinibacter sediminicola]MDF0602477.1 3'(2'),5'-bisphosphate nucleotidase CysQ [Psychromarinibacter sediminicola]
MPEHDLALLIQAARDAAPIANSYWNTDQRVTHKEDGAGPVSAGDIAVDTYLRETLTAARPGYGWLSEETEDDPARLAAERVFIVDPIDGTRAYVDGQTTWAHSLAVVERGETTAAVVFLPQHDKLYAAGRGTGATLNGTPIRAGTAADPTGANVLASRPLFSAENWTGEVPAMKRHFRPSLAYRLCLVAEGRFDAMLTLRPTWDWDIAAGSLIVTEAGGRVTDAAGHPLRFNSASASSPGAIAAPAPLHAALLARLAPR